MLGVRKYKNAVVRPCMQNTFATGGVFVDGKIINDTLLSPCLCRNFDFGVTSECNLSHNKALFLGVFYGCWGHCITDSLRI